jgi:hypothetical protein
MRSSASLVGSAEVNRSFQRNARIFGDNKMFAASIKRRVDRAQRDGSDLMVTPGLGHRRRWGGVLEILER